MLLPYLFLIIMVWSIYNYLFDKDNTTYLYNSYTNNLMEVKEDKKAILEACQRGDFDAVPQTVQDQLQKECIVVEDNADIYNQIKLERSLSRYNNKYLSLTIAPTTACNFRCGYCYEGGIEKKVSKSVDQSISDILGFVKSFKNTKYLRVTWYGGEPLLMFDFIKQLSEKFMEMFDNYEAFIITNGYLMNSEVVQAFKRYKVKGVQITIDGLEETHNQRRPHCTNKDSFQVIIKNLTTLFQEYPEVRVSLRVNVDKSNEDEYHELYHFLKDRFGDYHINIHPGYVTDDFSEVSNNKCMMQCDKVKFVLKQYDQYKIPISLYPSSSFGECSARHINSFVIGPEGELYKCWNDIGVKEKSVGSVTDFSFSNRLVLKYLLDNDPLESEECKQCFYFPICNGGCPYNRIFTSNNQCIVMKQNLKDFLVRYIDTKIK